MQTMPVQTPPEAPEAPEPVPFFQIDFDLACAFKALADRGAANVFVRAPDVGPSRFRRLRELGLVELIEGLKGTEARFTGLGLARLPDALKAIAAGPRGGIGA